MYLIPETRYLDRRLQGKQDFLQIYLKKNSDYSYRSLRLTDDTKNALPSNVAQGFFGKRSENCECISAIAEHINAVFIQAEIAHSKGVDDESLIKFLGHILLKNFQSTRSKEAYLLTAPACPCVQALCGMCSLTHLLQQYENCTFLEDKALFAES
tara:strand:- start:615 stop:1079 length:465 start_codon:yes stop_codon:yes gene_type:complete